MTLAEGRKHRSGNRTDNLETDTTQTQTVEFFKKTQKQFNEGKTNMSKRGLSPKDQNLQKKLCVQNRVFEYKILKVLEKNREVICTFRAIQ